VPHSIRHLEVGGQIFSDLAYADDSFSVQFRRQHRTVPTQLFTDSCHPWFKDFVGQDKIELQNLGSGPSPTSLQINDNSVKSVNSFVYLGSLQKSEDNCRPDMHLIWHDKILQLSTKIRLYQALVMSILLYATETWILLSCDEKSWRHSTRSANAKSCTYTGLSMSQTQKYLLVRADVICQYSAT